MSFIQNNIRLRRKDGTFMSKDEAVKLLKKKAHKLGFCCRSKVLSDGTVKLTIARKEDV